MKIKVTLLSLMLVLFSFFSLMSLSAENKVGFISDGELVMWDEDEFGSIQIRDSRTLIPLRIVSESLGLKVSWDNHNREALVRHKGQLYRFPIDKNLIIGPSKTVTTDVKNTIIGNRTYLPLRAFFELVGYEVDWQSSKKIEVSAKGENKPMDHASFVIVKTPNESVEDQRLLSRARSTGDMYITTDDLDTLYHVNHLERVAVEITDRPEPVQPAVNTVSQETVRNRIYSLYNEYPEGRYWDLSFGYVWLGNHGQHGYDGWGCVAFALEMSDQVFGSNAPVTPVYDFSNIENTIRVGDIISVDFGGHQVVVTDVLDYGVQVVEGNFSGMVHWGRVFTFDELKYEGMFYFTRY